VEGQEALALAAKQMGLAAWAPGANDRAGGPDTLVSRRDRRVAAKSARSIT
jgi:hypothetical protein